MKYIKILPIILILVLAVTGCSKNYEIDEGAEPEETIKEALFPDYNYDNNKAQLLSVANSAISESGYYLVINGVLYYYDISTDVCATCCYDANCNHSDEKCAAYFHSITYNRNIDSHKSVEECYGDAVFYYDDKIYMIESNKHEEYYLNQYNSKFGDKTRVAVIGDNKNKDITTYLENCQAFKVKDGYLYYTSYSFYPDRIGKERPVKVTHNCMRIKLAKDSEPEKLGEFEALPYGGFAEPDGFKILFDENSVYYISGGEETSFIKVSDYRIARYNTDNGDFEVVFEYSGDDGWGAFGSGIPAPDGIDRNCCMDKDSNLYFLSENRKQIMQYSVSSKTGKCFYSSANTIHSIAMNGEYIFISECAPRESKIIVLNNVGEVIQSMVFEYDEDYVNIQKSHNNSNLPSVPVSILGVDDRYIVLTTKERGLKGLDGNYKNNMYGTHTVGTAVVKKSDILNGKITDIKQIYQAK